MAYPHSEYMALTNVQVCQNGNWGNVLHTFPQGNLTKDRNSITCNDPNNPGRAALQKDGHYYIRCTVTITGNTETWEGDCKFDAGGSAPVEFEELELVT